jgi:hypothetical protein
MSSLPSIGAASTQFRGIGESHRTTYFHTRRLWNRAIFFRLKQAKTGWSQLGAGHV